MLIQTAEVLRFLESKGFTKSDSGPFAHACFAESGNQILVIDDSYTWQDVEMLLEDCQACGTSQIAAALQNWIQAKLNPMEEKQDAQNQ